MPPTLPTFSSLGAGPTVLMLHGIGGGHLAFAPQMETLASAGYRAVAWDMPGYGHSAPIDPYNFKGLAHSCIGLIEALLHGAGTAHGFTLLGHSMGGMVAQEVMWRRPDLVQRLVLCGTSASFGRGPQGQVSEQWLQSFLTQRTAPLDVGKTMDDLAATLVPGMCGPRALPEGLRLAQHCMGQVNPSTYRRALSALLSFDRSAELSAIACPTLLIAGEHDRVASPGVMRAMAKSIMGSSYVEIKGIGHLQNLEAPDDFDGALTHFLAQRTEVH